MASSNAAETLAIWVEQRPVWQPARPVSIPDADDPDDEGGASLGYAEGQSFMIEYVDSAGRTSTRRITVWHLQEGGSAGIPSLYAKCHERNAMRTFRIDRIKCCIDFDGVVHDDVPSFIAESFGMALPLARKREPAESARWNALIGKIRTEAVLLTAMSRCDGQMAASEIEVMVAYLAKVAEREGSLLHDAEIGKLRQYLSRLRPTPRSIAGAVADATGFEPGRLKHLILAAARVMDADERRHPQEIRLLNIVSRELLGTTLM
ncbi:tellurite resistance TerB family protein [Aquibium oceanicum]|uniref:WYL domain-containing protein n=1 Tax=Aquibium oceanicum TaxID=1670800 RepID=A0A1L3SPU7_9HYPH|nr:WYL domain-containing protein [Aquibium oceanicum]APH71418.1 hypothetical protein BSQ44_08595 [Aquibium oceanicum]